MSKKPRRSPTPRDREVEILTNPKLPRRLRLIDGRTGGVVLAVDRASEDDHAACDEPVHEGRVVFEEELLADAPGTVPARAFGGRDRENRHYRFPVQAFGHVMSMAAYASRNRGQFRS